jgi:membrane protein implicated in regulation of membrane protease activity
MVILGLLLIVLGALAIVAAVFTNDGSASLLGIDMSVLAVFLVGVAAGAFILWGWSILKYGTKQGLRQRRERRKLTELSEKLDRVQGERPPDEA